MQYKMNGWSTTLDQMKVHEQMEYKSLQKQNGAFEERT